MLILQVNFQCLNDNILEKKYVKNQLFKPKKHQGKYGRYKRYKSLYNYGRVVKKIFKDINIT